MKEVYVDWEKISKLIARQGVDLGEYGDSEVNYLSKATGRPWSTMNRVRHEGTTTLKTIGEIADALDCNPVDLLSTPGFPDPKLNALVVH